MAPAISHRLPDIKRSRPTRLQSDRAADAITVGGRGQRRHAARRSHRQRPPPRLASGRVDRGTSSSLPQTGHTTPGANEGAVLDTDRSEVTAERQLTVGEIIARHQQQQRAQDAAVQNYVAHARMEQHFRPTVADPGYDVVTENTYFSAEDGVEWEEQSFSVNGSKWGSDRPRFRFCSRRRCWRCRCSFVSRRATIPPERHRARGR
jgi:hypothetical protein